MYTPPETIRFFRLPFLLFACLLLTSQLFPQTPKEKTRFSLVSPGAGEVSVTGSFNGWNPAGEKLIKSDDDLWIAYLELEPGYYQYKFIVDGKWIPDPANNWKINDGGESFNSLIKVGNPPVPKRKRSTIPFPKDKLPEPVLRDSALIELYYFAWNRAWDKITHGTSENDFSDSYIDEGFNEWIYQWDSNFMVAFAMYSGEVFPAMQTLDNFYRKQRSDGYIQRVYSEANGNIAAEPSQDEPMLNPPLFAWIELRYSEMTGDFSRIKKVLPRLVKYHEWIEKNVASSLSPWLYYQTPLGSGMDNVPRRGVGKGTWVDFSSQMALAAKSISRLAKLDGQMDISQEFLNRYTRISEAILKFCWDSKTKFLYDVKPDGSFSSTAHAGAFWAFLAGVLDADKATALSSHLEDTLSFNRPHRIPTLPANDPDYDSMGHYWLGGVWAPVVYSSVKGLESCGFYRLADEIAKNHLENISIVFNNFSPSEDKIAFEERYEDGYKTIWECYSPEFPQPGTRWDNTFYGRQDFAGWTATGPVALLIENIIGLRVNAAEGRIVWRLNRNDRNGMKNLLFGKEKISLVASEGIEKRKIEVETEVPFVLEIIRNGKSSSFSVQKGKSEFLVE